MPNDELRLREGDSQSYSKLYVDSSKELHLVDSDSNDLNISSPDGYVTAIRSVFVDGTTGSFTYDTSPVPAFRQLNYYWQCAALDGTYSSGVYQHFYSKPFVIPADYASGGILKIYGFLDSTAGDVYFNGVGMAGVRMGESTQALSWWGLGKSNFTVTMEQEVLTTFVELDATYTDIVNGPIRAGDIAYFSIQRRAGDANDTASSGYFGIMGAEFFYNTNIPKKTY